MEFTHILGIHISKKTMDVDLSLNNSKLETVSNVFYNTLEGFKLSIINYQPTNIINL